jgi:hypothetical protein
LLAHAVFIGTETEFPSIVSHYSMDPTQRTLLITVSRELHESSVHGSDWLSGECLTANRPVHVIVTSSGGFANAASLAVISTASLLYETHKLCQFKYFLEIHASITEARNRHRPPI